ncbi:MAG: putative sensor domain DACNV-containing protein [Pyrinomonadaceae bacterium]
MSSQSTYQAARVVAPEVATHFARHLAAASDRGEQGLAPGPDARTIEAIIDATFWASLRREEGHSPKISLAFLPPEQAGQPLMLERRLPLTPGILTKLAPAVERPGIHLGVWHDGDELQVWGATRLIPSFCFVLEDIEPGLLVIKHRRLDGFGKFVNVAVLKGDEVKVVDENGTSLPDCPALVASLLNFTAPSAWNHGQDPVNELVQLAASMRAHGHGGSLLVVPTGSESWRNSIVHPVLYSITPPFSALADLVRMDPSQTSRNVWEETVPRVVDTIAGLTAVDGATVITDQYELLAFGVKIRRPEGAAPVESIIITEPIMGNEPRTVHPVQNGGTRHLSAAQFVHDQRDALALVASQDGRFTIFAWSPCEEMVHAHRVDVLLM